MLSFSKYQKFGVEIELVGIPREQIQQYLNGTGLSNKNWIVEPEETLGSDYPSDELNEIVSPILTNKMEDLLNLKRILEMSNSYYGRSDKYCAAHIHYDAEMYINEKIRYLQDFLLLFIAYEDIIFRFAGGKQDWVRDGSKTNAKSMLENINKELITKYLYQDIDYDTFLKEYIQTSSRGNSVNLTNISLTGLNTIEIRVPNGTLEDFIWFNNINLFGIMLDYARHMPNEVREKLYLDIMNKTNLERFNLERAKEFIELIKKCEDDEISFMKQYKKEF
jgi:hypothetical protein